MNLFITLESFSATSINEDIGIVLILATPVLLILAFILFIVGVLNKEKKPKIFKVAGIVFLAAGISGLVGLGQCGWY